MRKIASGSVPHTDPGTGEPTPASRASSFRGGNQHPPAGLHLLREGTNTLQQGFIFWGREPTPTSRASSFRGGNQHPPAGLHLLEEGTNTRQQGFIFWGREPTPASRASSFRGREPSPAIRASSFGGGNQHQPAGLHFREIVTPFFLKHLDPDSFAYRFFMSRSCSI